MMADDLTPPVFHCPVGCSYRAPDNLETIDQVVFTIDCPFPEGNLSRLFIDARQRQIRQEYQRAMMSVIRNLGIR